MVMVRRALYLIFEAVVSLAFFYFVALLVAFGIDVLFGASISFIGIAERALVTTVVVCLFTLYIFIQVAVRALGKFTKPVLVFLPVALVVGISAALAWYAAAVEYQVPIDAVRAYLGYGITAVLFFPLNYFFVFRKMSGRQQFP